jgi:basic membrane protein A
MSSMSWVGRTTGRRRRPGLVGGLTASALVLAACGGATGDEAGESPADDSTVLVFGAYATPLEEPWDGAIHAALTAVAEDGEISYEHVDNLATADEMERALRDIIATEKPDVIVGDAFAAADVVRAVAKESRTPLSCSVPVGTSRHRT